MSKEIHANTTLSHYRGWNDLSARQNQQQRSIHRHIATIHEIGESGDVTFIAMDFIDGLTLREKIHQAPTQLTKLLRHLNTSPKGRVTGKCFALMSTLMELRYATIHDLRLW